MSIGVRQGAGQATQGYATFSYDDTELRFMRDMPLLANAKGYGSVTNSRLDLYMSDGFVPFGSAGGVSIDGSTMQIPDFSIQPPLARFDLALAGPASAVFAALDRKPMEIFKKAGRSADFANGRALSLIHI